MKFDKNVPLRHQEILSAQFAEYKKNTLMTKEELRAVREWVKSGHSVYENMSGAMYDGQVPVEFLTEWRDDEYIRKHTRGMTPEETRKFALAYYGWSDDEPVLIQNGEPDPRFEFPTMEGEELPFQ